MRRPWMPPLFEGLALPAMFGIAALYDFAHVTPGPFMMTLIGLLVGSGPLQRAGRLWLQERREPVEQLPETKAALRLVPLMQEFGPAVVLLAVEETIRHRRALPRGGDHAER